MKVKWEGVYPALTTSFTKKGELDIKTFSKNVKLFFIKTASFKSIVLSLLLRKNEILI